MSRFSRAFHHLRNDWICRLFSGKVEFDPQSVARVVKRQPLLERLEGRQLLSAVYPEIDITGNSQSIVNNDVTPSTADFTDYGSADVNTGLITKTFKINNSGAGTLNLTGSVKVKISGANAADFSVVTQPSASIPGNNGSTSFSVKFDPSASGARAATLTIQNDDDDENPYVFSVQGTGTVAPKLAISGNNTAIPANDIVPRLTDGTDFGSTETSVGTITKTFTLKNSGSGTLTFDPATTIALTGTNAALFSILSAPATSSTLAPGASTTFQLKFTPAGAAAGAKVATVTVNTDDPGFGAYKFDIKATAFTAPIMAITGNSNPINNNATSASGTNDTSFGSTDITTGSGVHTFTIDNSGSAALLLNGAVKVAISGANPGDFVVTAQPGASVAAAANTTFDITFDPKASGLRSATVSISNNDTTHSPYKFFISGTGTVSPTINVQGANNGIANGSTTFSTTNLTSFGSAVVSFANVTQTYTIKNTGSGTMTLGASAVSVAGAQASDFTVLTQPPTTLAPGASGTFSIKFIAGAAGARATTVSINNDDPVAAGPFTFDVQGTGVAVSRMQLQGNSVTIASGDATPSTADFTDFGSSDISAAAVVKTFTINNLGSASLNLGGTPDIDITGPAAGDFTLSTDVSATTIAAAGSDTFQISFTPGGIGPRIATITIANNDPLSGNNPYTFVVQGTGTSNVSMALTGAHNTAIADGTLSTQVDNGTTGAGTDFGNVNVATGTGSTTFTIANSGTDALNLSGNPLVLIGGTFAGDFTVTTQPSPSIAAAGNTTFVIKFDPSGPGLRDATVTIFNDDQTKPNYTFNIVGTGVGVPAIGVTGKNLPIASGAMSPSSTDGTDFGNVIKTTTATATFTINNSGSGVLNVGAITFTGTDAADFSVVTAPAASLQPGASTTVTIGFTPSTGAAEAGTINIASNDPGTASYTFDLAGTGVDAGLVDLQGNGQSVGAGDTSPSIYDDTDFGKVEVNTGKVTKTFTIKNIGSALLTFDATTPVGVSGLQAAEYTISNGPATSSTLAAGASTTFQVTFDPTAVGVRKTNLVITTDDPINATYTIAIQGTSINAPVVQVKGGGLIIPNGDVTPRPADSTDFGTDDLGGATVSKTFTIKNIGSATLALNGTPKVTVSGANPTDFVILTQPAVASVAAAGTTTFVVRFNATAVGFRSAVINIASNDTTQNPYNFTVAGEGTAAPVMTVKGGSTPTVIANGDTTPVSSDFTALGGVDVGGGTITKTFTIANTGSGALTLIGSPIVAISGANAADFVVSTQPASTTVGAVNGTATFQITFDPSAAGLRTATVSIASDDQSSTPYTFGIQGTGLVVPNAQVVGSTNINSGDVTPTVAEGSDFGNAELANGLVIKTFTLNNTGSGVLRLTGSPRVSLTGANAADFSVVAQPSQRVASGGSSSFQIKFDPSAAGARNATVNIVSDDPIHPTYTYSIIGTGVQSPAMNIVGNSNNIANGANTTSTSNFTDFGSLDTATGNLTRTFTIQNTGSGALNLTGTTKVTIAGANAGDFSIVVQPSSPVVAAGSTTFQVKFDPTAAGSRAATISIANSDTNKNPYTFAVGGVGTITPIMGVTGGAGPTAISNGDSSPSVAKGSDFGGGVEINLGSVTHTFTIKNTGSAALSLTGTPIVTITGANASDYSVVAQPSSSSVAALTGTTTFQIKFDPSAAGARTATVNIVSSDPNAATYTFDMTGTGVVAPTIQLQGNGNTIAKGAAAASTTTQTDFGQVGTNGGTFQRTFTINNLGSSNLTITSVTFTGTNAADFSVTTAPTSPIAAGGSTTFTVTFTPGAVGARTATVNIVNNDTANTPFTFAIGGQGTSAPLIGVVGNSNPIANNPSVTPTGTGGGGTGTDFGSTDILGGVVTRTFTIKNTGSGALTLTGTPAVTISGTNAADFSIITQPTTPVAATTGTTTFQVKFDPTVAGLRSAIVTIASNDNTNSSYKFAIDGTGTTAPLIDIQGGSPATSIVYNATPVAALAANGSDFGNVELNLGTVTHTFTIRNTGSEALNFSGASIAVVGGANAADFTVLDQPRRSVAPGSSTTFTVQFKPGAAGARNGTITIASDDSTKSSFVFNVKGTGVTQPVIQLSGNGQTIAKGQTATSLADFTNFGTVSAASGTITKTFTITNLGSANLTLSGTPKVAIGGSNAGDFTVAVVPTSPVTANGGTTTFQITFDPSATGARTATVTIPSDDPNAASFTFNISGTGN